MGKKQKSYVESKDTALLLAESIAATQEEKTSAKKKHNKERCEDHASSKRPCSTSDKDRLKKAKEVVLARKAQTKKQKADKRKAASRPQTITGSPTTDRPKKKRGVSFA